MQADSFEKKPHDLNELLDLIVQQTKNFTKSERTIIYLYDEDERVLWNRAGEGAEFMELEFQLGKGIPGRAMESGEVINIKDTHQDERFDAGMDDVTDVKVVSTLVAPILDVKKGKKIGVIQVINKDGGFTESDVAFVKSMSAQAAIAIDNTILFNSLQQIRLREQELAEEIRTQNTKLAEAYIQLEEKSKSKEEASQRASRNKTIAAIGSIVLFIVIGFFVWRSASVEEGGSTARQVEDNLPELSKDQDQYPTYTVITKPLSFPLTLSGILEPVEVRNMFTAFEGTIIRRNFTIGEEVDQGQELLALNDEVMREKEKTAEIEELEAQKDYETYKNWANGEEVADARRKYLNAKKTLSKNQKKLEESKKLHELGIISDLELENETESLEQDVQSLENEERSLATTLAKGDEEAVTTKFLKWQAAKRNTRDLKDKLDKASIKSEINGVAIEPPSSTSSTEGKSLVEVGMTLREANVFVSIADLSRLRVLGRVDENDITKVKVDQNVKISGSAFSDITLEGKVDYVSSEAKGGSRRPYFEIRVTTNPLTEEQRKSIRLGMSATLFIITYENPKALMVPFNVIKITRTGNFVYRIQEGSTEPEKVMVETGITTQDAVEVTSGVEAGDRLVILTSLEV